MYLSLSFVLCVVVFPFAWWCASTEPKAELCVAVRIAIGKKPIKPPRLARVHPRVVIISSVVLLAIVSAPAARARATPRYGTKLIFSLHHVVDYDDGDARSD